jgi:hypothetical protein
LISWVIVWTSSILLPIFLNFLGSIEHKSISVKTNKQTNKQPPQKPGSYLCRDWWVFRCYPSVAWKWSFSLSSCTREFRARSSLAFEVKRNLLTPKETKSQWWKGVVVNFTCCWPVIRWNTSLDIQVYLLHRYILHVINRYLQSIDFKKHMLTSKFRWTSLN